MPRNCRAARDGRRQPAQQHHQPPTMRCARQLRRQARQALAAAQRRTLATSTQALSSFARHEGLAVALASAAAATVGGTALLEAEKERSDLLLHSLKRRPQPQRQPEPEPEPEPSATKRLQVGEFAFDDRVQLAGSAAPALRVKGTSRLTYYSFPVCCAALYLPEREAATAENVVSSETEKVLKLQYLRGVAASDFRDSTRAFIEANGLLSPAVERTLASFNALYQDVRWGDSYTLSFDGARVSLALNGRQLGAVNGAEFSEALFSVWFGEKCFMERLKSDLTTADTVAG